LTIAGCSLFEGSTSAPPPSTESTMMPVADPGYLAQSRLPTPFLTGGDRLLTHVSGVPFSLAWIRADTVFSRFKTVKLAPVSLEYLQPMSPKVGEAALAAQHEESIKAAIEVSESFEKAMQNAKHIKLMDHATSESVVVEVAIVQLAPMAPPESAPMFAETKSKPAGDAAAGLITIEMRFRDVALSDIVAMFAERRLVVPKPNSGLVGYGFVAPVIDEWMTQTAEMLDQAGPLGGT